MNEERSGGRSAGLDGPDGHCLACRYRACQRRTCPWCDGCCHFNNWNRTGKTGEFGLLKVLLPGQRNEKRPMDAIGRCADVFQWWCRGSRSRRSRLL